MGWTGPSSSSSPSSAPSMLRFWSMAFFAAWLTVNVECFKGLPVTWSSMHGRPDLRPQTLIFPSPVPWHVSHHTGHSSCRSRRRYGSFLERTACTRAIRQGAVPSPCQQKMGRRRTPSLRCLVFRDIFGTVATTVTTGSWAGCAPKC